MPLSSRRRGLLLPHTRWLCAYRPVSTDAREGQHNGVVTNALVKRTPRAPSHPLVLGMTFMVSARWSSVITIKTFGLDGARGRPGSEADSQPAVSSASPAITSSGLQTRTSSLQGITGREDTGA